MALALRFFLLLLLAAALPDRAAQAAPQRAWRAGPPTWTNQNIEDEKSLEASRLLDKMLSDLETRREMKKMALLKAVFPEGNSGTWAASAEGREAMPGTVPGDEGAETASPAAGMEDGLEPLGGSAGVSAGRTFPAPLLIGVQKPHFHRRGPPRGRNKPTEDIKSLETSKHMDVMLSDLDRRRDVMTETGVNVKDPVRLSRIVGPRDVRKSCVIDTVLTVLTVQLVLICGFFGIRKVYKIRRNSSVAPASW
ncbi:uncharacterized protein LOC131582243 [Poecile atricapillus]|uniref:uncharacterized protein LOC131582243 n=1 Tax=Poecile atricapillus TaxID=48891 RepID=UPI002739A765|nr:uncharacterized protein LOC131582243 [Poecile atricapillus]